MLLSNEFDPTTYRNKTKFEVQNLKTPKKSNNAPPNTNPRKPQNQNKKRTHFVRLIRNELSEKSQITGQFCSVLFVVVVILFLL